MKEKRNSRAGIVLAGLAAAVAYLVTRDGGTAGGGGLGLPAGNRRQAEMMDDSPEPVNDLSTDEQGKSITPDTPETSSVEESAPSGPSGDPQTQTIATGTMSGPGEETTIKERGRRRQAFASTEDPGSILNPSDDGETDSEETRSSSSESVIRGDPKMREEDGSYTITGGGL